MIVIHRVVIPTFLVTHVSTSLLPVKSDDAVRTAGSGLFHFISPHVTYTPSNSTHRSRPETTLYASNDAPFRTPPHSPSPNIQTLHDTTQSNYLLSYLTTYSRSSLVACT